MGRTNERGYGEHGERGSALWGTGSRGGDSRSSVLWGKGGRGFATMVVAALALAAPIVATADSGSGSGGKQPAWVQPFLLDKAKSAPDAKIPVIITSVDGVLGAESAYKGLGLLNQYKQSLALVDGIAADLPAKLVEKLADVPGVTVTYDSPVRLSGVLKSTELWPNESQNSYLWQDDQQRYSTSTPTIAIVDSGIQANRDDFTGRIVANVNMTSLPNNSAGDGRGHGTFVAGIAAGSKDGLVGAAPFAKLAILDVMDDRGMAATSDVIAAAGWIYDNKGKYNIRVANFSLHSTTPSNFWRDPLDKAVEKLWFSGVTVVAAAGNYGSGTTASGVKYAPGNDPFVITVGAVDSGATSRVDDDSIAPWSAWGRTYDGFLKPEVVAPGRYMVGPVQPGSTLTVDKASNMVGTDRIQLSGTSFAAPVVAGSAAQLLARHPTWTPGQVKAALMLTARKLPAGSLGAGAGEVTPSTAVNLSNPGDADKALMQYVVPGLLGAAPSFDGLSWYSAAKANRLWDAVSWSDVSWSDVSWSDVSWSDVSWSDVSWSDAVSWGDVSWGDVSWCDVSWSDVVSWSDSSKEDAVQ
jgi:serine protease AprX